MLFLLAAFMGWAIGTAIKDPPRRSDEDSSEDRNGCGDDDCTTRTRYLSGYDPLRDVSWELTQKYKYCK